jgi:hypothetical protein
MLRNPSPAERKFRVAGISADLSVFPYEKARDTLRHRERLNQEEDMSGLREIGLESGNVFLIEREVLPGVAPIKSHHRGSSLGDGAL